MEINIVKWVQSLACGFLDSFLWIITKMGEETFFLLVLLGIYLLYDKRFAFKYSMIYLFSVGVNFVIKNIIKRPRPHIASSEIMNKLPASGYSFPSGHSQGFAVQASTMYWEVNKNSSKKCVKIPLLITLIVVGILVMLSRLYFGQHYLTDVLVGAFCGIVVFVLIELFLKALPKSFKEKFTTDRLYLFLLIVSSLVFGVFFVLEIAKGVVKAKVYKLTAVFIAISIGYLLDKKYIHYNEKLSIKNSLLKAIILYSILAIFLVCINVWLKVNGIWLFLLYLSISLISTIILPLIFTKIFWETDNGNIRNK